MNTILCLSNNSDNYKDYLSLFASTDQQSVLLCGDELIIISLNTIFLCQPLFYVLQSSLHMSAPYQSCQYSELQPSESKSKLNVFRKEIRNRQIREFKSKIREEVIKVNIIEQMFLQMPFDHFASRHWASDLVDLYGSTMNFRLTAAQTVELFRLVQKFPNKTTFELFQIVIFKADIASIDQIFQYDIMKLLHSCITSCQNGQNHFQSSTSKLNQSEESERIIKEAVICTDTSNKIKQLNHFEDRREQVEFIKVVLRIIGELCRKQENIRNFAVLNHKTFTYCLKAYKQYGDDLKTQFYTVLCAFTFFPFERNEEQFGRITNRLFSDFFGQMWRIQKNGSNEGSYIKHLMLLMNAMYNLLIRKCGWIIFGLKTYEKRYKRTLINILITLIQDYNVLLLNFPLKMGKDDFKMIRSTIDCVMIYEQIMDSYDQSETDERESHERVEIYFQLATMLITYQELPQFQELRPGIYCLIGNFCIDRKIANMVKYSLFAPDNQQDLLSFLAIQLSQETQSHNIYELSCCLHSIFEGMPVQMIEPHILPSEILQTICFKLLQQHGRDVEISNSKIILSRAMIILLGKLDRDMAGVGLPLKKMILDQFRCNLMGMISRHNIEKILCRNIEQLLYVMEEGS